MDEDKQELIKSLVHDDYDDDNDIGEKKLFDECTQNMISILTSSSDSDDSDPMENVGIPSKQFIDTIDNFSDEEFQATMRIKRSTAQFLMEKYITDTKKLNDLNDESILLEAKLKFYMFIWYVVDASSLQQLGKLFNVSKSIAWSTIASILPWFISIGKEYISWPKGRAAEEMLNKFQKSKAIPDTIGILDSININITTPLYNSTVYLDETNQYSIYLQGVIGADKRFMSISCGEPGSLKRSAVLMKSALFRDITLDEEIMFPKKSFLVASAAYPTRNWLITPLNNENFATSSHTNFNKLHAATLSIGRSTFDLVKCRFPRITSLSGDMALTTISSLAISICILHNICIELNDMDEYNLIESEYQELETQQSVNFSEVQHDCPFFHQRRIELINTLENNKSI